MIYSFLGSRVICRFPYCPLLKLKVDFLQTQDNPCSIIARIYAQIAKEELKDTMKKLLGMGE
jgi:hypothetical protein